MNCSLCQTNNNKPLRQRFYHCVECDLIFLDEQWHLSPIKEKARYEVHQNSLDNKGYVIFLNQILDVACELLPKEARSLLKVLDFGSGPNPNLPVLLAQRGFSSVNVYDPFFSDHKSIFEEKYDLILLNEVIEHFNQPRKEILSLQALMKSSGILLIQTQLHQGEDHFKDWWYARDPTHVVFFSEKTFCWICSNFSFKNIQFYDRGIVALS